MLLLVVPCLYLKCTATGLRPKLSPSICLQLPFLHSCTAPWELTLLHLVYDGCIDAECGYIAIGTRTRQAALITHVFGHHAPCAALSSRLVSIALLSITTCSSWSALSRTLVRAGFTLATHCAHRCYLQRTCILVLSFCCVLRSVQFLFNGYDLFLP